MVEPLVAPFRSAGYGIAFDERKRRYIRGMLRLIGGLEAIDLLRNDSIVRLLSNAQLKKGTGYTFRELISTIQPRQQLESFRTIFQGLASKQVFLRGYRLKCPECDLEVWYGVEAINEHTMCVGCRSLFQLPLELAFAYRLNQLFAEGLNQGALTVLLTALYLNPTQWETNLILKKSGNSTEIDLIAESADGLILAECKDNYPFDDADSVAQLCEQLQAQIQIARAINAHKFIFSTLYEGEIPPAFLADINDTSQGDLETIILTREVLLSMPDHSANA